MYGKVFHINAVDEHLAFLYIIVTRNQIYHRTLTATALTNKCNSLAFWYYKVATKIQEPQVNEYIRKNNPSMVI